MARQKGPTIYSKTCPTCGKTYETNRPRQQFCSKPCIRKRPIDFCERCGKPRPRVNRQFCSRACRAATDAHPPLNCIRCDGEFKARTGSAYTNEFCSLRCWHETRREIQYPIPLHHRDMFRRPHKRALLERAGGKCEQCGSTEQLEFDHVIPRHMGGKGTLENGQVLCRACHLFKTATQRPAHKQAV